MQYLDVDSELSNSVSLIFADNQGGGTGNAAQAITKNRITRYKVDFQFAPRITSDSKSGDWDERSGNSVYSEPVAIFKGSKARTINIKWSYIIDGNDWTTKRVSTIAQALRGYFARMDNRYMEQFNFNPTIVYFQMYRNQYSLTTFRLESTDISFSDNLIVPDKEDAKVYDWVTDETEQSVSSNPQTFNPYKSAFPLRTDISVTLKPYVRGALIDSVGKDPNAPLPVSTLYNRGWF